MRKRWIQVRGTGELVPAEEYIPPHAPHHYVMPDIQPYQSQINGEWITSRSRHREHLREGGRDYVEVGNDVKSLMKQVRPLESPPGLKQRIIEVANSKLRRL